MSVSLTSPNDLFMQILYIEMPGDQHTERGLKVALFGSAIGSAYLSTLGDDELKRIARRAGLSAETMPLLRSAAAEIRRDGYSDGSGPDKTFWTIAMPLPAENLPLPMVLGVAGPSEMVRPDIGRLRSLMREAISRWLTVGRDF